LSPFRIPAFRNLILAQAISQLGDSFYFVIFAFMVLKISGSTVIVGLVSALELLPHLLLSAYAGVVADRIDRRRIMLLSDLVSSGLLAVFAVAVLVFHAAPPVWMLATTAASLSTARVFFMPSRGAAVPSLVPAEALLKANSLTSSVQNVMPLISLSLSAGVLAILYKISPTWFFLSAVLLNMLSFLGSAVYVARLPKLIPDRDALHEVHPMQDLRDGIRYVRGRHELLLMLVLQLALNLVISPFFVVYLAANRAWFHDLPHNLAWLEFSFFLGMVLSSLVVGRFKITKPGLAYVFSLVGVGVAVMMMGFTPNFWPFVCWNLLAGLCMPFGSIPLGTYMQLTVPDAYRGRVNSAWNMVSIGVQPIGLSLGGLLIQKAGIVGGFVTMGAGMAIFAAVGLLDGQFRRMKMPDRDPTPALAETVEAYAG